MRPQYDTLRFYDIYPDVDTFIAKWKESGIYQKTVKSVVENETTVEKPIVSDDKMELLYWLLYAKYGNNPIANQDEHQFEYRLYSIVFQYGPTWERRCDIQETLRDLSEADLMAGTKMIYNDAYNPSTSPATTDLEEIKAINAQKTSNVKRGKIEAYTALWEMLSTDVTNEFIMKFADLFLKVVTPFVTAIYEDDEEEEEED